MSANFVVRLIGAIRGRLLKLALKSFEQRRRGSLALLAVAMLHPHCSLQPPDRVLRAARAARAARDSGWVFVSGTGNVVLVSQDFVRLLPLSARAAVTLGENYRNWATLRSLLHARPLVAYEFVLDGAVGARVDRLQPLSAGGNLEVLRRVSSLLHHSYAIAALPADLYMEWNKAVSELLEASCGEYWRAKIRALAAMPWRSGPTHYDLTSGNVLELNGDLQLIDLARFQVRGIQVYDVLHFLVDTEAKKAGESWTSLVAEMADKEVPDCWRDLLDEFEPGKQYRSLLEAYFLTRLYLDGAGENSNAVWLSKVQMLSRRL